MMTFRLARLAGPARPAAVLLCAGLTFTGVLVGAARPAPAECACWRYVRTGDAGPGTTLGDVAAPTPEVAWAAGSRGSRPMLMTWTGIRWRETPLAFSK